MEIKREMKKVPVVLLYFGFEFLFSLKIRTGENKENRLRNKTLLEVKIEHFVRRKSYNKELFI